MDCLHCGKKLSMVKKLTTGEFCSAAHKKAYLQEQEKFALARLLENQDRLGGKAPVAEKKDLEAVARDSRAGRGAAAARESAGRESAGRENGREHAAEAAREIGAGRAARRPMRGKTKREDVDGTPVEGDYLLEPVRAAVGPQYLALPHTSINLHVDPVMPEFGSGVEAARSDQQPSAKDTEKKDAEKEAEQEPFFAVSSRFGLEAIFGNVEQEACHADYLALAEFAAHGSQDRLKPCGSGEAAHFDASVQRPMAALEIHSDWLQAPARRESENWERAIDALADSELAPGEGFDGGRAGLRESLRALAASDGARLEAFGPKRFAFSRLPELPPLGSNTERWAQAEPLPWEAVREFVLTDEPLALPKAMPFAVEARTTLSSRQTSSGSRRGSIHELAASAPVSTANLETGKAFPVECRLRGEVEPLGTDYGYLGLPLGSGCRLEEVLVRYESEGLGTVYRAGAMLARTPRGPYDLSRSNRYFPPPPRIASVPRLLDCEAHPRLETRLVAVGSPAISGPASQVSLRANGELKLSRGNIFLPKIKHKIRPVILDESFYDALGQLTAGNRDFSLDGFKKHWNLAPNDLRWVAMAIPIVLGLVWYSSSGGGVSTAESGSEVARADVAVTDDRGVKTAGRRSARDQKSGDQKSEARQAGGVLPLENGSAAGGGVPSGAPSGAPIEPGVLARVFGDESVLEVKRSIQKRAAVELSDDFRQGLGEWSGVGDWASGWSYDKAGFLRPRQMGFYTPTLELTDYRFEFLGQIERKALSWVFRAADSRNYYVNRLEIVEPGPLPDVVLVRYAVIGGKAGPRTVTRLPMQVQMDTLYRIRVDVQGKNFVTTVQGQVVDVFSDERITRGGVGFFAAPGEDVRLRWVEVSHQYDFLGRLCAFLVPYNVSK